MRAEFLHRDILKIASQRNVWIGIAALMGISNVLLSTALFIKSERIILVPPHITKTLSVEGSVVSKEYLEEMGLYMSKLLLDLTPTNFKPSEVRATPSTLQVNVKGILTSYVAGKDMSSLPETVAIQFSLRGAGLLLEKAERRIE